jgi:hypothetical protein
MTDYYDDTILTHAYVGTVLKALEDTGKMEYDFDPLLDHG